MRMLLAARAMCDNAHLIAAAEALNLRAMDAEKVGFHFELSRESVDRLRQHDVTGKVLFSFLETAVLQELKAFLTDEVGLSVGESRQLYNRLRALHRCTGD